MSSLPILSFSILLPLASALYIIFLIGNSKSPIKQQRTISIAISSSVITFISTLILLFKFDNDISGYQFVEKYQWIEFIGLDFHVGIDGLSIYFILLTALLSIICMCISVYTIKTKIKEFLVCFLMLESFCIGTFSSMNLLLFYGFFEVILIPMYLIIGIWGGENRVYAAIKFFLYTFFGSVFLLLALIYIFTQTGTFNMLELPELLPTLSIDIQKLLWLATFISFAIKVPMIPFHTWLPDAHVQAPTAGSVILAGILLKLGGYAMLRVSLPMLPGASEYFAVYVIIISAIAVIYASYVALNQTDMKKMIAYSSVAHMGYVTGGIFTFSISGISGAVFQMISHGLISSSLFLLVGMLYERHHTKEISNYGGVAAYTPMLATFFMIATFASIGLPGTSGFIGEFFSIIGIFEVSPILGIMSTFGVIIGAVYMLGLYKNIMFGTASCEEIQNFVDLKNYEKYVLLPLIILIIYLGLSPNWVLSIINVPVKSLAELYNAI
ncbi:MAG: NADH-quinone oxidoreductase subunit M [Acinetobacter sp.]|uniref:NADH-quinone oxidoreductase subunit M n=1 Tax=Acinetobacter sp. TaxID=472 RepID=UPI000FAF54EA|nr:NADH-quinone oxidoreductase subunit M [Acinetobacter sp.]RUP42038.1 MAG: NADH-quinone oxidoreductase subunit M [Acinetobacter sp.]